MIRRHYGAKAYADSLCIAACGTLVNAKLVGAVTRTRCLQARKPCLEDIDISSNNSYVLEMHDKP